MIVLACIAENPSFSNKRANLSASKYGMFSLGSGFDAALVLNLLVVLMNE